MVEPITLTLIAIGAIISATAGGVGAGCFMATSSLTCAEGSPHLQGCAANATSRVAASWKVIDTTNTEATISVTTGVDRTNEWAQDVEAITSSSWAAFTLDTIGGVEWLLGAPPSFDGPHPRCVDPPLRNTPLSLPILLLLRVASARSTKATTADSLAACPSCCHQEHDESLRHHLQRAQV